MDIKLNSNLAWSAIGNPGPTQYDVQNVTTHEAGHFLVLLDLYGEEYDYAKTMYGYGSAGEISKRDLEPEDIAGINYIYPAFTLGTAGSDVLWAGVIGVTGNATIPSGRTLTVLPGTRVTFPANVSLTISGTLKADGTSSERITLDRSGTSNWYGTRFTSTASSSSYLKNSTLSYASYAVRIEGSSPLIQDCTISDNNYSIYVTGSGAYPIIERCYVAGTYPLYAVNSCDPEITNSKLKSINLIPAQFYSGADGTLTRCSFSTISGNNCLLYTSGAGTNPWVGDGSYDYGNLFDMSQTAATKAVYAAGGSPKLGDNVTYAGGYNDFTNRSASDYYVYNTTGSTIKAENNYWGAPAPQDTWFFGSVDKTPFFPTPQSAGPTWKASGGSDC